MLPATPSTVTLAGLESFCQIVVKEFKPRQLVTLEGPLGAGKTQFVKKCVEILGGEVPDSPTFSLINEYSGASHAITHVDLYRLTSEADVESTGFWDLFREEAGLIFVEWPDRIPDSHWPRNWARLHIEIDFLKLPEERTIQVQRF